ncbi:MAG: pilus assembly protein [Lachnospiraceae bacterium]|nr:pilus assembly protein [Lachnospiraceae bacterium]
MMKAWVKEQGMLVVEATFVFPIMFFVLFFLLYAGNMYYQRSRIDNLVSEYALKGAAYCADPFLEQIGESGSIPSRIDKVDPYNGFGNMSSVESQTESDLRKAIGGVGFFAGMEPRIKVCSAEYHNYFLYETYSVEVSYAIRFPIRFLGSNTDEILQYRSYAEVPVANASEFVQNTDMAVDYMERFGGLDKIKEAMNKVKEFLNT